MRLAALFLGLALAAEAVGGLAIAANRLDVALAEVCLATISLLCSIYHFRRSRRKRIVWTQPLPHPFLSAIEKLNAGDLNAVRFEWDHRFNGTRGVHPFRYLAMRLPHGADPHIRGEPRVKYLVLGMGEFA